MKLEELLIAESEYLMNPVPGVRPKTLQRIHDYLYTAWKDFGSNHSGYDDDETVDEQWENFEHYLSKAVDELLDSLEEAEEPTEDDDDYGEHDPSEGKRFRCDVEYGSIMTEKEHDEIQDHDQQIVKSFATYIREKMGYTTPDAKSSRRPTSTSSTSS